MDTLSNDVIKKNIVFISESGISNNKDLKILKDHGIKGVLIGEKFMKEENIENSFKALLQPV